MSERYGLNLSKQQEKLFKVWNKSDPVDENEVKRNRLIRAIQGNGNKFIE